MLRPRTVQLRWVRIGGDIDLLDAPGIIPMSFKDQVAAQVGSALRQLSAPGLHAVGGAAVCC